MNDSWASKSKTQKLTSSAFTDPHIDEDMLEKEVVILVQAKNFFGDAIYSYVQLTFRNMREMMKRMYANESFQPAEYGTVLAAGRGEPPKELREEMANSYNLVDVPLPKAADVKLPPAADNNNAQPVAKNAFAQPKFWGDED